MISTTPHAAAAKPEVSADARQVILKEIGAKWGKFSEQDLSALKGNADRVNHIATYGLEKARARHDVDAC